MQDELLALLSDRRNASAWNNLILKKLMVIQLATQFAHVMEPEGRMSSLKKPAKFSPNSICS